MTPPATGLPSRLLSSSARLGWRGVVLEEYEDPPVAGSFVSSTPSFTLVRVTSGRYRIESRNGRRWHADDYRVGSIGVTAPGHENVLRWRSSSPAVMRSQHLHLDPALAPAGVRFPDALTLHDPYVTASAQALEAAFRDEAPAVYAESVAAALVAHLVYRVAPARPVDPKPGSGLSVGEIELVIDFMQAHLADDISLDQLAALVGLSKYHFLRLFSAKTGETPSRYLARLRLRRAAELLQKTTQPISTVAATCGYRSPGQFAAAFRREHGCTPRIYRNQG